MKGMFRVAMTAVAACLAVVAAFLAFVGMGQADPRPKPDRAGKTAADAPVEYPNPSAVDTVEWLPLGPADHRILYDDSPLTFGDLRLPDRRDPDGHPVVVFIHGGGWESSWGLSYTDRLVEALTDAGVATWSLEFRRLNNPGGGWPGTFLDVAHGTDFLRELAPEFNLDLDRVVAVGHSSGGHLAMWLAGRHKLPADSEIYTENPLALSGVVDLAGVLDFELALDADRQDTLELLGVDTREEAAERWDEASPRHLLPLGVPQSLIIGSRDNDWRNDIQARFTEAANALGDDAELTVLEGANHFDVVDPCGPAWPTVVTAVLTRLGEEPTPRDLRGPGRRVCGKR